MVDKLQSGGVQVNQIADALGGHVRIQQSGGHHTGVAVAQGAAGVEGMAQTCKSSRKSTLGGLVISIGVPGRMTDSYPCTSVWYAARVGGSSAAGGMAPGRSGLKKGPSR